MLPLIILAGPTTSRKSDTAIELAEKLNAEIISADSMQVYRYFDIGTAKVSLEDRRRVSHHLIDILEPDQEFTAFDFKIAALNKIREIIDQQKVPIITGGTGLYLKVLCEDYDCAVQINSEIKKQVQSDIIDKGLSLIYKELKLVDPTSAKRISPFDTQRIERAVSVYRQTGKAFSTFSNTNSSPNFEFPIHTFLIERERKDLYSNINRRVDIMMKMGWVEEVKHILDRGFSKNLKPFQSIGYEQIVNYLDKKQTIEKTIDLIKRDTRHYAKRQITWFKKLCDAKTINADFMDNPISLKNKILSILSQTVNIFLFSVIFSFGTPLNANAKKTSSYSSAFSHFQKGNYHQATLLFRRILSSDPSATDQKRALYLLAHSLIKINKPNEAIEVFLSSIKFYPEMEDYIRFHLAITLLESGKSANALEQINILHKKFPNTSLFIQSNILLAKILEQSENFENALNILTESEKVLSKLSRSTQLESYLPEIIFYQGKLYQKLKKINIAYSRYRLLHISFPANKFTQESKEQMNKLAKTDGIAIKPLTIHEYAERVANLLRDIQYQQVVTEVTELIKINSPLPGKFYFYLAKAQKGLRKRNLANAALRKFLKLYPEHTRVQEALFTIGRNFWNTGYYSDGLKYFKTSINKNPHSELANQARFFIGKMHEEKKRYSQATKYYTNLVEKFETSEFAERAAWQLGWLNYTKGSFKKAFDYFDDSSQRYPSGLFIENSMFWNAKSAEKLKHDDLAQQIFKEISIKFPYTYYGIRAGEKRTGKKQTEIRKIKEESPLKPPKLPANAQFHYYRGVELSATGFYKNAKYEIKKLEGFVRKNFSGVIWLTSLYNKAHAYSDTVRVMQLYKNFKTKSREKELAKIFWKNFYPLAYSETIRDRAKKFGINPYFVKGLIRQESLFNADVQSRAGAIGLMQIMPKTGKQLHADSKLTGPFSTDILFNPEINIQLGIQYIHQLKNRFKENKTYILISYNAGPHNLKKWLKRFNNVDDPDVFIESIPYPETRKYVKKVLRNHGIYQTLYPGINS